MATRPGILSVPSAEPRRSLGAEAGEILRNLDYMLLAAVAGLVGYGLWVVRTVTIDDIAGDPLYFVVRQAIYAGVGVAVLLAATWIDPELYRRYRNILYTAVLALMVLVFVVGPSIRDSKRWIDLGSFQLQPSELGKIVVVLTVAGFLADRARRLRETATVASAVGLGAIPILLVFFQPDFGTAVILSVGVAACLYFAGARWLHLAAITALAAGLAVAALWVLPSNGIEVLKPYQVERLTGFIHPDADPSGTTYNVNQSLTAVGAGGLDGRGVEEATQTRLNYLPEHHSDFVFASLAEQRGFLGVSILLLLYAVVVWRGIKIVALAETLFSTTVAGALVAAFLFQVFLNIGMTIGIAPVTGIPLPFVSYGGSSMITTLATIGILQAIHARGRMAGRR
jgi:rod shape determining protein RodA